MGILCAALGLHIAQQPAAAVRCPNPIEDLNSVQGTVLDSMLPASISMQAAFVKLFGEIAARLASPACPRKRAADLTLCTLFGALLGPMSTPSMVGFLGHAGLANLAAILPKV